MWSKVALDLLDFGATPFLDLEIKKKRKLNDMGKVAKILQQTAETTIDTLQELNNSFDFGRHLET